MINTWCQSDSVVKTELLLNGHSVWVSSRLTAAVDCWGSAEPIYFLNSGDWLYNVEPCLHQYPCRRWSGPSGRRGRSARSGVSSRGSVQPSGHSSDNLTMEGDRTTWPSCSTCTCWATRLTLVRWGDFANARHGFTLVNGVSRLRNSHAAGGSEFSLLLNGVSVPVLSLHVLTTDPWPTLCELSKNVSAWRSLE